MVTTLGPPLDFHAFHSPIGFMRFRGSALRNRAADFFFSSRRIAAVDPSTLVDFFFLV